MASRSSPGKESSMATLSQLINAKAIAIAKLAVRATTAAGSGHPTSALSLAHLIATLMYHTMRRNRPPRHAAEQRDEHAPSHVLPPGSRTAPHPTQNGVSRSGGRWPYLKRPICSASVLGSRGLDHSRCNFSEFHGQNIHCFDLVYPQREKRAWDGIVTRISLSLRPLQR
jgi:hypothetical protein